MSGWDDPGRCGCIQWGRCLVDCPTAHLRFGQTPLGAKFLAEMERGRLRGIASKKRGAGGLSHTPRNARGREMTDLDAREGVAVTVIAVVDSTEDRMIWGGLVGQIRGAAAHPDFEHICALTVTDDETDELDADIVAQARRDPAFATAFLNAEARTLLRQLLDVTRLDDGRASAVETRVRAFLARAASGESAPAPAVDPLKD